MTELTNLTVAGIRDGHRAGDFSAVEVAEAFNANVAGAKALNAFIVETPEHAIAAAKAAVAFAKTTDKFEIVGGAMGSTVLDVNGVKALAELPSLDELRAKIIGLVNAPATKLAQLATAPAAKLARVFGAYAAKDAA